MNVYEKLKEIEYNIDSNLKRIRHLAVHSHSRDTFYVIEEISKISTRTADLIIEKQQLLEAVDKLNKKDKLILEYKYDKYPELSSEEIAKKLGISIRTYFRRLENLNVYKEDKC